MIDWSFIGTLEGERLSGYIPDAENSQSGVTIGTGIDLGQIRPAEMARLNADLVTLIQPYVGLRGQDALSYLMAHPLTLTVDQVNALDFCIDGMIITPLRLMFNHDTSRNFDMIPDAAQTVMASVTFQYGTPWIRCPIFWRACTALDWADVVAVLRNFGDHYPARRNHEADYLEKALT